MAERRNTIWYVEIKNGKTNDTAMEHLAEMCDATPDKFTRLKDCVGILHHLLIVDRSFVNTLAKNREKFKLMYLIYCRHENDTCVRVCELPRLGKISRTKKFKSAQRWVHGKFPKP